MRIHSGPVIDCDQRTVLNRRSIQLDAADPHRGIVQQSVARLPGATFLSFRERRKHRAFAGVFLCGMMFDLAEDAESDEQLKMVRKILAGGQTGADRAGLDFAIHAGLEHGGYVPRGRKAEDGRIDDKYNMVELSTNSYL